MRHGWCGTRRLRWTSIAVRLRPGRGCRLRRSRRTRRSWWRRKPLLLLLHQRRSWTRLRRRCGGALLGFRRCGRWRGWSRCRRGLRLWRGLEWIAGIGTRLWRRCLRCTLRLALNGLARGRRILRRRLPEAWRRRPACVAARRRSLGIHRLAPAFMRARSLWADRSSEPLMRDVPAGMVADFSRHAHDFFPRVRTMRPGMKPNMAKGWRPPGTVSPRTAGRSARRWCRRSRTNSTAPCRSRGGEPCAGRDRSASQPRGCRG